MIKGRKQLQLARRLGAPILKPGKDASSPESFRPIALTSFVWNNMVLEEGIAQSTRFCFSTSVQNMKPTNLTSAVLLDMSKAFVWVWHKFLITKLHDLSSIKKIELHHLGRTPPSHPWYFGRNPGGLFKLMPRKCHTAFSRFVSGHIKALSFRQGQKIFPECYSCYPEIASPAHILTCLDFKKD
ncbi:hypothetical protein TNCV_4269811 [Trichonephila clavipes]|nr:hypothetical protein TNCV_4269811 [Trichonephila clavipes]